METNKTMMEYKKNDVLAYLRVAFEAGVKLAKLTKKHGLVPGTAVRDVYGNWLRPEAKNLNRAWSAYLSANCEFRWALKGYHDERRTVGPVHGSKLFDLFMKHLPFVSCEDDLRNSFETLAARIADEMPEDCQAEFDF